MYRDAPAVTDFHWSGSPSRAPGPSVVCETDGGASGGATTTGKAATASKCHPTARFLGWKRGQSHTLTHEALEGPDTGCSRLLQAVPVQDLWHPGGTTSLTHNQVSTGPGRKTTPVTIRYSRCVSVNPFCSTGP